MKLRNEALVGLVVIMGIIAAVIGAVWLSGRSWGASERIVLAAFDEVGTISEGNPVKYRGVNVGRVEAVELSPGGTGVYVTLSVDDRITLPRDAGVLLSAESMFGDWQAEIVSQARYPDLPFTRSPRRDILPGSTLPDISELTAVAARIASDIELLSERIQIAFTPETAVKIRETVENMGEVSERITGFIDRQTLTYGEVGDNMLASTANIRQATAAAQATMADVRASLRGGDVQQILGNARVASENLQALSAQLSGAASGVPGLVARTDSVVGALGQAVTDLRPGIAAFAPTVTEARSALTNFNALLTQLQTQEGSLGRLLSDPALYEEFQRLVVTMQRLMADIQANPGKYIGELQVF